MNIRRVRVAFTKIATCMGFGLIAAAWVCNLVYQYPPHNHYANFQYVGVMFGLFVGVSWTIKQKEVRKAFVGPSVLGLWVFLFGVAWRMNTGDVERLIDEMAPLAIAVGLFVGGVRALARARGESITQVSVWNIF